MSENALFAACRASPDDDAPRLVWADAIGGDRGELVVLQCDLARGGLSPAESGARRRRCRDLLARHGVPWSGLRGLAVRCSFHRGFVEAAMIDQPSHLPRAAELVAAAPLVRALSFVQWPDEEEISYGVEPEPLELAAIADPVATPWYGRVRAAYFALAHDRTEAAIPLLARAGAFAKLEALAISTLTGAAAIRLASAIPPLHRLELTHHDLDRDAFAALVARCPDLRALVLSTPGQRRSSLAELAGEIPRSVVELRAHGLAQADLAALAASPVAARLEQLEIELGGITDPSLLAAFPRLRSLSLHGVGFPDERAAVDALVALRLPALRELRCPPVDPDGTRRIAAAFGPQLEYFDGRNQSTSPAFAAEIQALVAGDAIVGPWAVGSWLLPSREAALGATIVELWRS